jgi:hypothetical protein
LIEKTSASGMGEGGMADSVGKGAGAVAGAAADVAVGAPAARAGTVKVPLQSGHFISWPANCSGTVSIF